MFGPGRLIAVDGFDAAAVEAHAATVAAEAGPEGAPLRVSRWDASGLFAEMLAGGGPGPADIRTLTLIYAADLAFRLRWEILPLIVKGQTVIAAPYTATAVAIGRAAGLPGGWLRAALQIAPPAHVQHIQHIQHIQPVASPDEAQRSRGSVDAAQRSRAASLDAAQRSRAASLDAAQRSRAASLDEAQRSRAPLRGYGQLCFTAAVAGSRRLEEQAFRRRVEAHLQRVGLRTTSQDT